MSVDALEERITPAAFTPGDLVIYRVGTGAAGANLVNTGNEVFLDEYTPSGTLVQSIAINASGSGTKLIAGGTASSEGLLSSSPDGKRIAFTGYDTTIGGSALSGSAANRSVGIVGADGVVALNSLSDLAAANTPRSAVVDGDSLFVSGGAGGVRYAPLNSGTNTLGATTSTQLSTTVTNIRATEIYGGQLYVSSASGAFRLASVGTGEPTTAGQTIANLPGFPTGTGSPYEFFFADLSQSVAGVDTVYVADDGGTIQKYSLVAGSWTANGSVAALAVRGLAGVVNGSSVSLYGTTGSTSAAGSGALYAVTDTSGYNATMTGTVTNPANLAAGSMEAFRGVALAPDDGIGVIGGLGGTTPYAAGAAATIIGSAGTFSDLSNFKGGSLTVSYNSGGQSGDTLAVNNVGAGVGQIGVSGNAITYNAGAGAATIGAIDTSAGSTTDGLSGHSLKITFNAVTATTDVLAAAVQSLMRQIQFSSATGPAGNRVVSFAVAQNDGKTASATQTVSVTGAAAVATNSATLDGSGNLTVADTASKNNVFSISLTGGNIVIADVNNTFISAPTGWTLAANSLSISRPSAGFTGSISFNGGPGTDKLAAVGNGSTTAVYTPSGATNGSGLIQLSGGGITGTLPVNFLNFEPLDISGMTAATVMAPANAANALVVDAGFDVASGATNPAIVVSGTTGSVPLGIEAAHLFNNTSVTIDTSATTGTGSNTITVSSAIALGHNNTNLTLKTNVSGSVTVNAALAVAGTLTITSPTANLNADLSAATLTGTAATVNVTSAAQLQDAVNVAASGATLFLAAGTYPGNVTLTNPFTLNVASGAATISGALSGTPGLTKAGAGTLALTGVNTYLGDTKVNGGVLQIGNDNQLGSAAGVVTVATSATLEITSDTTTSRTFLLNANATLQIDSGKTLTMSGAEIDGGALSGPGAIATIGSNATSFNGARANSSLTLNANVNAAFTSFDNSGTLNLAATKTFTLGSFTNTTTGKIFVNGTANVTDFVTNGQTTVASTGKLINVGSSGLTFGGGSVTNVNSVGQIDNVNDGLIDLGNSNALLAGGLIFNNGFVGSFNPAVNLTVDFGGLAKGYGEYSFFLTKNGGAYSPGTSPGTASTSSIDINGGGTFQFEISNAAGTAGALSGWDRLVVEQSVFNSSPKTSLTATPQDKFNIHIVSLVDSGNFNTPGLADNFDPHQSYAWEFLDASNPAVTVAGAFDPAAFNIVTTGFANSIAGNFSVASNDGGRTVFIVYTPTPVATATTLTATPLATTGGMLVGLTATVAPSPGALGTVTFLDQGVPIPGGSNVPVSGGVAAFSTSFAATGSHAITAAFTGSGAYQSSTSNAQTVVVSASTAEPHVVSATPNGGLAGFAGSQHSRIVNMSVVFDRAVQLDANAIALALHTNNVRFGGVAQPNGFGTLPTALVVTTTDNKTWTVTFSGNTEIGADGFNSLVDGVYDLNIDAAKVHPLGSPTIDMLANSTTVLHRLFGDTNDPTSTPNGAGGADFSATVNSADNLAFRAAFNNDSAYKAFLDFGGDGVINTGDNLQFRGRFGKTLTWSV